MCCFSRPVRSVSATSIFARPLSSDRQALAYAMAYEAAEDLAMVLPVPAPPGTAETAVEWIDLSGCPDLFDRLVWAFPHEPVSRSAPPQAAGKAQALHVARVGSFEASFAPSAADLDRLDSRFRLSRDVVAALPVEGARGFVVAQLRADATQMHPLGFSFPRADPDAVFFPTIHVHDGEVHPTAHFDHTLVLQAADVGRLSWEQAERPAKLFVDVTTTGGLVDPDLPMARLILAGDLPNEDVTVRLS